MARHRQRARDRKLRQPLRENLPGELDHSSGEVEEVEATIIAGAGGEPGGLAAADEDERYDAFGREREEEVAEEEEEDLAVAARPRREAARSGPRPEGNAVVNFIRASWAELQRVQWPDRRQVAQ